MSLILHYSGHRADEPGRNPPRFPNDLVPEIEQKIAMTLEAQPPTAAFGALASGADILFAEALMARRVPLHVILPFAAEDFITLSVAGATADWTHRFKVCWAAAASHFIVSRHFAGHEADGVALGSHVAMGLALLEAQATKGRAFQCALWDGRPGAGPAGTAADIATWRGTGSEQHIISLGAESGRWAPPTLPRLVFSVGNEQFDSLSSAFAAFTAAKQPVHLDVAADERDLAKGPTTTTVSAISPRAAGVAACHAPWRQRLQRSSGGYVLRDLAASEQ